MENLADYMTLQNSPRWEETEPNDISYIDKEKKKGHIRSVNKYTYTGTYNEYIHIRQREIMRKKLEKNFYS